MGRKRIDRKSSRTAGMTCLSRAVSSLETTDAWRSDDSLAVRLLPGLLRVLVRSPLLRSAYQRFLAPAGIYEYVIARTKLIDDVFRQALDESFDQILLFGAGFDTRALRLQAAAQRVRVFELDAPTTQDAKIRQYARRHLSAPSNLVFVPVDFAKEAVPDKLDAAGFRKGRKSLFILEGLLMYLEAESVRTTWKVLEEYAGSGSWVVFDYVQAAFLRGGSALYGGEKLMRRVSLAGEPWTFGMEPKEVALFLDGYGFSVREHLNAEDLEARYFQDEHGQVVGRVNGTHCIVIAERK